MFDFLGQVFAHGLPRELLRHCVWLILLCAIFAPLEFLFAAKRRLAPRGAVFGDLGFYFISGFLPHWLLLAPLAIAAYASYHFVPRNLHVAASALPLPRTSIS